MEAVEEYNDIPLRDKVMNVLTDAHRVYELREIVMMIEGASDEEVSQVLEELEEEDRVTRIRSIVDEESGRYGLV